MKLPKQLISDNDKNEDWGKKTIKAIISHYHNYERYSVARQKDYDNYQLVDGNFNDKEYEYVTKTYGLTTPARLVNYPLILPKLNLIVGELMAQGLNFTAHVVNRDGVRKKNEAMISAATESLLRPIRREMEAALGTKLTDEELDLSVPQDLKEFDSTKFRTHMEEYMMVGLQDLIHRFNLKHEFKRGMYDTGIVFKEIYHITYKNGLPYPERIDPRDAILDYDNDKEDVEEGKFGGVDKWYTVNQVIDEFPNLPVEKVRELEKLEGDFMQGQTDMVTNNHQWYRNEEGSGLKVRVVKLQWRSLREMKFKLSENPYDPETPYVKLLKPGAKTKKSDKIEKRVIDDIYQGVLLGHDMIHDFRRSPNQIRYEENYAKATLDYVGVRPNTFSGSSTSLVDALKNIQMIYNITMYSIQLAMARSGARAVIYDVGQKPKKMSLASIMHHAKNSGMIFINSKQEGNQMNTFNQWSQVDFTMSNTVNQLSALKGMLEDLADKVTGISAARAGIVSSSDLVGVNQSSQMQSSLITLPLFEAHFKVVSKVLNKMAGKLKYSAGNKKWVANLYGDNMLKIVEMDKSIGPDEYSIFLENSAKDMQDKRDMIGIMDRAINSNNGTVDLTMLARALRSESASSVEKILNSGVEAAKDVLQANEERKMAIQEQANQIAEKKMGIELEKAQVQANADITVAQINNQGKIAETEMKLQHDGDSITTNNEHELDKMMLESSNQAVKE